MRDPEPRVFHSRCERARAAAYGNELAPCRPHPDEEDLAGYIGDRGVRDICQSHIRCVTTTISALMQKIWLGAGLLLCSLLAVAAADVAPIMPARAFQDLHWRMVGPFRG